MNNADTDLRIYCANRGPKITFWVDGDPCTAYEGETVHAALLAEGIRVLRIAGKTGEPRGIFCGMGVCYECRVTINGVPDQQACMTLATDGMQIETR